MTPDISVVVPVYNPGLSIEPCIASMLAQTLPADRFEVVFVDDGSTDEAPARLDALAAEHPNFRVIHTANSGWAGRPRNIGMDAAQGRYVQLVDQDDALTPRALERLVAMGDRNGSDIVIGKVASDFRTVPLGVFRENRERCTIADAPLIDSLTPHKAFRTAFLRDQRLRFAEGRRRLEDQLFMVQSYFAAKTVSILADEVIYRYMGRPDRGNTSNSATTAEAYLGNLREVVDVVVANTSPGDFRDMLLRRFVRVEMLNRLSDRRFSSMPPDAQAAWFAATRPLVLDFAGPGVERGLEPLDQVRLQLVRSGDVAGLALLATRTTSIRAEATLSKLTWLDGRLRLRLACRLVMGDGSPLTLRPTESGWTLHEPLSDGILDAPVGWAGDRYRPRVSAAFRDPRSGEEWALTATTSSDGPGGSNHSEGSAGVSAPRPVDLAVTAGGDPLSLAAGRSLPVGRWLVQARIQVAGIDRRVNVSVPAAASNPVGVAVLGAQPLTFVAGRADDGALTVAIESGAAALGPLLAGRA
ncbi:MAG: glycosyltransferase family 2 protein, partial [Candidatus Limnocylindrales bacterium]